MSIFDDSLYEVVSSIEALVFSNKIKSVTIIRDLWGRIRIAIEYVDNNLPLTEDEKNQLNIILHGKLKEYWLSVIWEEKRRDPAFESFKKTMYNLRILWQPPESQSTIKWYRLERRFSKQSWLEANRFSPIWEFDGEANSNETAIVSFYSFKGGVGRSTALAAVALLLADAGKDVFVLDLDLESPGISNVLIQEENSKDGILDYLIDVQVLKKRPNLSSYVYMLPVGRKLVKVIGAGSLNGEFIEKLGRIDFGSYLDVENALDSKKNENPLKILLSHIREEYHPDFILMDVRAGFHDLGGLSLNSLSHLDVIFARNDSQSLMGLKVLLRLLGGQKKGKELFVVQAQVPPPSRGVGQYDAENHELFRSKVFDIMGEYYYLDDQPDIADDTAPYGLPLPFSFELQRGITLSDLLVVYKEDRYNFKKLAKRHL